ncbi:thioredoxin domain-containing protein [Brevibacterium linens]|uniref:thioredoxin domain-containing protein n=1 Tax=Brevibacterium linens TaxID=1703 RepID=UPI003F89B0F2
MPNELADSTSPYLRAHADNPVDWRMWTKETLAEAARRDVPLLISIGYSTCHWCHVMAHESFEDEAVAAMMNDRFVPVKIDREELPDIDAYYMNALQAMTGQGGWPMTVFATPAGSPFYAGTYFPPAPRGNLPAFTQVLSAVSATWTDRRDEVNQMTARMDRGLAEMAEAVTSALPAEAAAESLTPDELDSAAAALLDSYDPAWGGFGGAPKFPPMMNVLQLLAAFVRLGGTASANRGPGNVASAGSGTDGADSANAASHYAYPMDRVRAEGRLGWLGADGHLTGELVLDCLIAVRSTLARIASGGMRDQVRGGIARYSVDRQWFVPHFEKMLYDNALYLRAVVAWAKVERALDPGSKWLALAEREVADTADFLISDLSTDDGFIAALDADSLNSAGVSEEGAAYVFTPEEFAAAGQAGLLGLVDSPAGGELSGQVVAAVRIIDWLGMEDVPFDADHPAPWDIEATRRQREVLEQLRARRSQPARDEKIITEWNSLAVTALAEAALYSGAGAESVDGAESTRWAETAVRFWTAMDERIKRAGPSAGSAEPAGSTEQVGSAVVEVRRSFTGRVAGPGRGGLADWAQTITAGITVRQLSGGASSVRVGDLVDLAATMLALFTSERGDGVLEAVDSLGDGIIDVKSADPVDNTVPSGRSAAAEALLLLAEIGVEGATSGGSEFGGWEPSGEAASPVEGTVLDTGRLLEVRDRLLGVYRALAGQAPRGCGHALWQAERALSPVRVATVDETLRTIAATHPTVTLLTASTGVPGPDGREVDVPAGTAIVCRGTSCSLPVGTAAELVGLLNG